MPVQCEAPAPTRTLPMVFFGAGFHGRQLMSIVHSYTLSDDQLTLQDVLHHFHGFSQRQINELRREIQVLVDRGLLKLSGTGEFATVKIPDDGYLLLRKRAHCVKFRKETF